MTSSKFSLCGVAALALIAGPASATVVTRIDNTLGVTPPLHRGNCPAVITFHGRIRVTGQYAGGVGASIAYQFTRSTGAKSQIRYVATHGPGVYDVIENWTVGGPQLRQFSGWERFAAWPADSAQNRTGTTVSNQAHFTVTCR